MPHRPQPPDPRTTDSVSRYLLPHPISALYRLVYSSHRPGLQFGFSLRLVEGAIHFLALVNLADAVAGGMTDREVRECLSLMENPGTGKWLALFKATTGWLAAHDGAFLAETEALVSGPWHDAADRIKAVRNRWAHDEVVLEDAEARPLLKEIAEDRRVVLHGLQFLRHYHLGSADGVRPVKGEQRWTWYPSRGLEETGEPVTVQSAVAPPVGPLLLLSVRDGRALSLSPMLHRGLAAGDQASHVMWLHRVDRVEKVLTACFRHPVLRQESRGAFPDPTADEWAETDLAGWMAVRRDWPGRPELGMSASSLAELRDPFEPRCFDERYRLIGALGEGGMGSVWEAEDLVFERRCALKRLKPEFARSPATLRRFQREGRALASLDHAAIVPVYEMSVGGNNVPYISMGLVEGESLAERLQRVGPYSVEGAVALMEDLLVGLEYVHSKRIVHRDLKPSNVMLTDEAVKIVDFGIAHLPDVATLTKSMDVMGSVAYMAPERDPTPQSDIYSAGRLFFTLLTGRAPAIDRVEALAAEAPGVPREVEEVYERATARLPGDRHRSAKALAEALRAGVELARTPTVEPHPRPPGTRGSGPRVGDAEWAQWERTMVQPVALAIQRMGLGRGPGDDWRYHNALASLAIKVADVAVQYLSVVALCAQARIGGGQDEPNVELVFGERATLGGRVGFLRSLDANGKLADTQPELTRIVSLRNEMAHGRPERGVGRHAIDWLGMWLSRTSLLHSAVVLCAVTQAESGAPSEGTECFAAMGAAPSGWKRQSLSSDVGASVVVLHPTLGPVPLAPLARWSRSRGELLFYAGLRSGRPMWSDGTPVTERAEAIQVFLSRLGSPR